MPHVFVFALLVATVASAPVPAPAPAPAPAPLPAPAPAPVPGALPPPVSPAPPIIELVTVGPGPSLVHRWGHAALCVAYPESPELSRCFNYGAVTATTAGGLAWHFLRGKARFKVVLQDYMDMIEMYEREDRDLWVQPLPFTPAQVQRMLRRLEQDQRDEGWSYIYHHMHDNCATRLRDHIDAVTDGALRRVADRAVDLTFRQFAQAGLGEHTGLVILMRLTFGRGLDRRVSRWASMAHPDYLRRWVHYQLGAEPVRLYQRKEAPVSQQGGSGAGWVLLLAILLALPVGVTRRLGRYERVALGTTAVLLTLVGCVLWFVALVTTIPELRYNEVLLVFWPTDFLLLVLGERWRQLYGRVRLGWLAGVSLLAALGVLVQPLFMFVLVPSLTCLTLLCVRAPKSTTKAAGP